MYTFAPQDRICQDLRTSSSLLQFCVKLSYRNPPLFVWF